MASIADRLGISGEHDLVIGTSFNKNNKSSGFHSIRYDFKPASVDASKTATVDVGEKHSVTVTVPHLEGPQQTVYRGSSRPYQKECVLVVNRDTGEIRLEKLSENIQVKKTRQEGATPRMPTMPRPLTPIDPVSRRTSPSQQASAASGQRLSPHAGPRQPRASAPARRASPVPPPQPPQAPPAPGSMPMLGMFDEQMPSEPEPVMPSMQTMPLVSSMPAMPSAVSQPRKPSEDHGVGVLSDSDSDSDSGSSSDSDMDVDNRPVPPANPVGQNGSREEDLSMPSTNLITDLQLSDDDSD